MYYSSGNYEAFARPLKPEGIEQKSAYFVGTGLAALAAGCFLVRDAQMPGSLFCRYWPGRPGSRLLPGARCADAGKEHSLY